MLSIDFRTKKLNKNHARKLVAEIICKHPGNVHFSNHASEEMEKDNLTTVDVWNVLKSSDSRIVDEGELIQSSYRYRLETNFIMVVISFHTKGDGLNVVTVWDKRKERKT